MMLTAVAFVYFIKYGAESSLDQVVQLRKAVKREQETLTLLRADWARLNQPQRLQELTQRHYYELKLESMKPEQIGTIDSIPMPDADRMEVWK